MKEAIIILFAGLTFGWICHIIIIYILAPLTVFVFDDHLIPWFKQVKYEVTSRVRRRQIINYDKKCTKKKK